MCARLSCILRFRVHVKLLYRIVSYRNPHAQHLDCHIAMNATETVKSIGFVHFL